MAQLVFNHIKKRYSDLHLTVKDFHLEIPDKEFLVLVGPSGCGKSTTLRMIAGLEDISEGELYIDGKLVNNIEAKDRDIAMVFQNYALYPHMSVFNNIAFGLKQRCSDKKFIHQKVTEVAKQLDLTYLLQRKPKELSGGQRQRVALGRAIVREPKVFLMDEPLSNLDAKLRVQTRGEISKLHKRLGATVVYVTHDQTEAMTMGDRIVVMNDGVIQQHGCPEDVYKYPANKFVAGFIGSPSINFVDGEMFISSGNLSFSSPSTSFRFSGSFQQTMYKKVVNVSLGVRPESLFFSPQNNFSKHLGRLEVVNVENTGAELFVHLDLGGGILVVKTENSAMYKIGSLLDVYADLNQIHIFDKETGGRLSWL